VSFHPHVWNQLKKLTAEDLIDALVKDKWEHDETSGAVQAYRHSSGKRVTIHYHPRKTYGPKFLKGILHDIGWSESDMKRLKLIK
jgi:predicted RNA binding protein YcfA (HicA-like mRNA interferase family)